MTYPPCGLGGIEVGALTRLPGGGLPGSLGGGGKRSLLKRLDEPPEELTASRTPAGGTARWKPTVL